MIENEGSGVLPVYKPSGMTSHDVVSKMRKLYGFLGKTKKRIGCTARCIVSDPQLAPPRALLAEKPSAAGFPRKATSSGMIEQSAPAGCKGYGACEELNPRGG